VEVEVAVAVSLTHNHAGNTPLLTHNRAGNTPLHLAVSYDNYIMSRLLIERDDTKRARLVANNGCQYPSDLATTRQVYSYIDLCTCMHLHIHNYICIRYTHI